MSSLQDRTQAALAGVRRRISSAAVAAGRRPDEIDLLAVSKSVGADAVLAAWAAGQTAFGENYVQEGVEKIAAVARATAGGPTPAWHFIGPIQGNKTREIARSFDWVESVDRLKIAQRLSDQRPADRPPLQVLVQVNISGEDTKGGVPPEAVAALIAGISGMPRLNIRGLMAIPAPATDPQAQRAPLAAMKRLFDALRAAGQPLDTLSMGMSADLEAAIDQGATRVRIGTAIFGART